MRMTDYAKAAMATAVYPLDHAPILYPSLGLAEEAGEVAGQAKRIMRDDGGELTEERRDKIIGELGDVLWYVAAVCRDIGVSLTFVAASNLLKIQSRKERGVLRGEGSNR